MEIHEKVEYLANLAALMAYHEDLGASTANRWIAKEFASINDELISALKDKHDEAGKRNNDLGGQGRADSEGSEPRSGVPDRERSGDEAGASLRRPGV